MLQLSFKPLKSHYTTDPKNIHKCNMRFPNTCAIRMSEALVKANSEFLNVFKNAVPNKCSHSYVRGAQDLGAILAKAIALGPRSIGWSAPVSTPSNIQGKQGIICFMNIPGFSGQGHIDLWDKLYPVGSDYWDAETIWFWELSR